jgi:hypothetical protein
MIGWKRIVVTVGEKIGKSHLTYAQGASAELMAAATIGLADFMGLPVSTTHVLSSGIAGTMAANRSGLQKETLISILLAWVLTLPVCDFPRGDALFRRALRDGETDGDDDDSVKKLGSSMARRMLVTTSVTLTSRTRPAFCRQFMELSGGGLKRWIYQAKKMTSCFTMSLPERMRQPASRARRTANTPSWPKQP